MSSSTIHINRIAYISPQGQLATIDADGRQQRVLTQLNDTFQFPAWAPNGDQIAVIGNDRTGAGIFISTDHPNPSEPTRLYYSRNDSPFYLYWSPDCGQLSFIASQPQRGIGLYLATVSNHDCKLLTTGQPLFWAWSPQSNRLLIHCDVNEPEARLAFFDLQEQRLGPNLAQPGIFQAPGVAPTGRFYAYAEIDVFDNGQLVVEDSTSQEQITVPYEGATALGWSPTQDQLAFISPPISVQRAYGPLQLLDTRRKSVQILVESTVLAFFWSPDGQNIAYLTIVEPERNPPARTGESTRRQNGVYRTKLAPAAAESNPVRIETLLLELWVVNIASKQKRQLTTFEPDPVFINQFLPFFDQYALSHRLWSPAGDALVLPVRRNNTSQVTIIPINGDPLNYIVEGNMAFWSCQ